MGDTIGPVVLEGWTEAIRGLKKIEASLPKALQAELKGAADIVRVAAVEIAGEKGLAPPGRSGRGRGGLVGGLKVFANATSAGVRDSAKRKGYPYPAVYEFGSRGSGDLGPRAFLQPAGAREAGKVEERIDNMFDRLRSEAGLGGGL